MDRSDTADTSPTSTLETEEAGAPPPAPAPLASAPFAAGEGERLARLRLARSRNVGPRTFAHLLRRFGTAGAALGALSTLAGRGGVADYRAASEADAEAECRAAAAIGARMVVLGDDDYPPLLGRIDTPPPVLALKGDPAVFRRPAIAIVGARNASALGLRTARGLAGALGEAGYTVVSGLARGIDAAAHGASLPTGTVAVLAGGLDRVYPPENQDLAARIGERGALISECAMGVEPTGRHFPKRNRLIAGLGLGVVLVEAATRSGSLITARYAVEQGREVMACPGAPEDPRSGGCNALIRDGATLVRDVDDVLEAVTALRSRSTRETDVPTLAPGLAEEGTGFRFDGPLFLEEAAESPDTGPDPLGPGDAGLASRIADLLGPAPVETDDLLRITGAPPSALSLALLELELAGRVEMQSGGRVALLPTV